MPRRPDRNPFKNKPPAQQPTDGADDRIAVPEESNEPASPPRIIGGKLRGRKLTYSIDPRTRPMKDRVREAVFNLVGPAIQDKHCIDLFAGTGALGFEALSRGARSATLVERHFPTADLIKKNAELLELTDRCQVLPANTLLWAKRLPPLPDIPWVVFCSPPYVLYVDQLDELLLLIEQLMRSAPAGSVFVVEADSRFDFARLPRADEWDVRDYRPAIVGILHSTTDEAE